MKKLVIFPFNGNAIEALDCVDTTQFEFLGFIDDDESKVSDLHNVLRRDIIEKYPEIFVLAVPGSPESYLHRKSIISSLPVLSRERFITIQHHTASVGKNVRIGINCLIMAGVVITSNARIGDHVCVLPGTVIHHDSVIGDYTLIGSKVVVAGGTSVGENCYVGSGSNIMNGLSVGNKSLIGMGSTVIHNVAEQVVVAGNPARDLSIRKNQKLF